MEWQIVLVIIALVGFISSIVAPILKLNTAITKLNTTLSNLDNLVYESKAKQEEHEKEAHKKFNEYEHRLTEHTTKIKVLENEVFGKRRS